MLGVRPADTHHRVVRPTETGAAYWENCKRILGEIEEAELSAADARSRAVRNLAGRRQSRRRRQALSATPIGNASKTCNAIRKCGRNCVLVDRNHQASSTKGWMWACASANRPVPPRAIPVGRVQRAVVCAPSHPERHGTPCTPDDLAAHTLIQTTGISTLPEWRHHGTGRRLQLAGNATPRLPPTNDAAISAAVAGLGPARACCRTRWPPNYGAAPCAWCWPSMSQPLPPPIHVIHREGRHAMQKVRAFLDLAIDRLRADESLND